MAWKKIIVGGGVNGAVLPEDITSNGTIESGYYLGVLNNGTGVSW